MANISEIAASLQSALTDSGKAHKALEDAKQALQPLEDAAQQADNAVSILMNQYQSATATGTPGFTTHQKNIRGGSGKKRAPRTLSAIVGTAATRLLNADHAAGKKKVQSLNAALDRVEILAKGRGEKLTEELKASITAKAESIWSAKK